MLRRPTRSSGLTSSSVLQDLPGQQPVLPGLLPVQTMLCGNNSTCWKLLPKSSNPSPVWNKFNSFTWQLIFKHFKSAMNISITFLWIISVTRTISSRSLQQPDKLNSQPHFIRWENWDSEKPVICKGHPWVHGEGHRAHICMRSHSFHTLFLWPGSTFSVFSRWTDKCRAKVTSPLPYPRLQLSQG